MSDGELGRQDVAAVNLAAAAGLPGSERIDRSQCLRELDAWAGVVRTYTDRVLPRFHQTPDRYDHSEAYFRVLVMITVLQRDLGVRYNPEKVPEGVPFDVSDAFVHGAIRGPGGTCATLPVVYAAVGRRLGYPIKLVSTTAGPSASHQFNRWEGTCGERFNIEASATGLSCHPDDYYRTGRYAMAPEVEAAGCYLRSKTPREELAGFLAERAVVWDEAGRLRGCVEGYAWASALAPDHLIYRNSLDHSLREWGRRTRERTPPGFPPVVPRPQGRNFPDGLPVEYERDILTLAATESLLDDSELRRVWDGMRLGEWGGPTPAEVVVSYSRDGGCDIGVRFARR